MARCTAMPPPMVIFMAEKSRLAKSGSSSSALKSVFTPAMPENRSLRRMKITRLVSRGLAIRILRPPSVMNISRFTVSEKM